MINKEKIEILKNIIDTAKDLSEFLRIESKVKVEMNNISLNESIEVNENVLFDLVNQIKG